MSAESNSEKSVSYQKKDGFGHVRPSFFWYDNDKDLKVFSHDAHRMRIDILASSAYSIDRY